MKLLGCTLVTSLAVTILFLPSTSVFAAKSYSVTPLIVSETLEPRDMRSHTLTITNSGRTIVEVFPVVNEISLDEGGNIQPFVAPGASDRSNSITSWIAIKRSAISIPGGESVTVPLDIAINPKAVPGEYHARIAFGAGRNIDVAKKQIESGQAPSTVVTIKIPENKTTLLKLATFVVDRFITSENNEGVTYRLTNTGETEITPRGEVVIYNTSGEEVGSLNLNDEQASIAPGDEKIFKLQVPTKGLLGKYKAFLSVEYGVNQTATVNDTSFFYVLPWKQVLLAFVLTLLLVTFIVFYLHRRHHERSADNAIADVPLYVRNSTSDAQHHDIDLKQ